MADEVVACPNCGFQIPISEVLTHQIRESLKAELETGVRKREASLLEKEKQLDRAAAAIEAAVAQKAKEATARIQAETEARLTSQVRLQMEDLKRQLNEKDGRLLEAQKAELALLKQKRELEEARRTLELQVARRIDSEKDRIRVETLQQFSEEHRLKDAEKDKLIKDLRTALEDAQRKATQGSMQTQGEVQELDLEGLLRNAFPFDEIRPVPKGIRGADAVQLVLDSARKPCGTILWEAKHTKHWSDGWVQKLKDDQREISADIAVIVTEATPKGVDHFSLVDGVWVTRFSLAVGLATALRQHLTDVTFAKLSAVGKSDKMEMLYQYLSGPEFRRKIEAIVETFTAMKDQLDREKRAMAKIWKEREKQIQRITMNTAGMYGDMRGIIGASLPEVDLLELGAPEQPQLEVGLEPDEP